MLIADIQLPIEKQSNGASLDNHNRVINGGRVKETCLAAVRQQIGALR